MTELIGLIAIILQYGFPLLCVWLAVIYFHGKWLRATGRDI